nr:immunoglobulin heavy chain junction region [Macaca mulatta]MOW79097.1 immunoglobulin heavy chain junction region [Macaca mulatta]MOW79452.1 immunoglobulin heavy chain junction region [Macaca mulatta]MOW79667.1 immunoglobulin heavy chain junction region [Macaca mulatta]MOW80205.1 immunoglobulin heavy chain junction region [Macaca mulatta]
CAREDSSGWKIYNQLDVW